MNSILIVNLKFKDLNICKYINFMIKLKTVFTVWLSGVWETRNQCHGLHPAWSDDDISFLPVLPHVWTRLYCREEGWYAAQGHGGRGTQNRDHVGSLDYTFLCSRGPNNYCLPGHVFCFWNPKNWISSNGLCSCSTQWNGRNGSRYVTPPFPKKFMAKIMNFQTYICQ